MSSTAMIWTPFTVGRPIKMSHNSRSMTNLVSSDRYDHRSRSRSRSRMVIEKTEVKQGGDTRQGGGYMQVEISMAVETMLDNAAKSSYRTPIKVQYQPGIDAQRSHEQQNEQQYDRGADFEEWASSGARTRSQTTGSYGSILETEEKHVSSRSKSGSLREFLSDYDNIVNGGGQGAQTSERNAESGYRSESAFDSSKIRFGGSSDPVYNVVPKIASFGSSSSSSPPARVQGDSTLITETSITTTTAIKKVSSKPHIEYIDEEDTDMPRVPSSPVPPLSSPPVPKTGGVSALTQQFEMNARKHWVEEKSRVTNGNKWSPKGGPKPKELPQLMPTVEFKTTPTGAKYKKLDYEIVDSTKTAHEQDKTSSQYSSIEKKEERTSPTIRKRFVSPTRQKEQISVYEYDSGQITRRTEEMPTGRSVFEQESQRVIQSSQPRHREWTEETKSEIWSSSSKGAWQYDTKKSIPTTTPSVIQDQSHDSTWITQKREETAAGGWLSDRTLTPDYSRTSRYERALDTSGLIDPGRSLDSGRASDTGRPSDAGSSTSMVVIKEGKIAATETWDTSRKGASYSTASTLVKTRELDEETAQREDRKHTPIWAVIKTARQDDRKEIEAAPKSEGTESRSSYGSRTETHTTAWGTSSSSKSEQDGMATATRPKAPEQSPAPISTTSPVAPPLPKQAPTPSSGKATTEYRTTTTTDKSGKTTTTTTATRHESEDKEKSQVKRPADMEEISVSDYRSTISARPAFTRSPGINMSSPSYGTVTSSGGRILKTVTEIGSSSVHSGGMSPFGQNAASSIRDTREREKKEMSDLNDRLASYIEKVRFLEAQNRKLAADLDLLRGRWGKDSVSVRAMYEGELQEARKVINDTNSEREDLEKQIRKLMDDLADYRRRYEEALRAHQNDREKIDELLAQLSNLEAELNLLRRRISNLEEEVSRIKKDNIYFVNELNKARSDLDQETLNRIDFQNQVQTLLEEIDFMRRVHDQEISELQAIASRDTTPENREYFKNELSSAIRDIRAEYDQICNANRTDMESWYKLKVQEIQTQSTRQNLEHGYAKEEVKRLRVQLSDLRGKLADLEGRNSLLEKQTQELNYQLEDDQRSYEAALNDRDAQIRKMREECQSLMLELQMLLDTKQTLDAEIAIYRKMLEGEENRAGLRQLVEQVVKTHGLTEVGETESLRVLKGETASRTSFQRSAKGNVSIQDAAPDGKYIILENTHRSKEEAIGEWKLKRKIDGKREIIYTLPRDFILRPGKSVKIWARGQGMHSPPDQLVFDAEDSFGSGSNVQTILFNKEGEERATHIQRSSHTIS